MANLSESEKERLIRSENEPQLNETEKNLLEQLEQAVGDSNILTENDTKTLASLRERATTNLIEEGKIRFHNEVRELERLEKLGMSSFCKIEEEQVKSSKPTKQGERAENDEQEAQERLKKIEEEKEELEDLMEQAKAR